MYKFNEENIEKLKMSKVVIDKLQSIELVKKVLHYTFPSDYRINDIDGYYKDEKCLIASNSNNKKVTYIYDINNNLNCLKIEDFFEIPIGSIWQEKYNTEIYTVDEVCNKGSFYVLLGNGKELNPSKLEVLLQFIPIQMIDLPKTDSEKLAGILATPLITYFIKVGDNVHTVVTSSLDNAIIEAKYLIKEQMLSDPNYKELQCTISKLEKTLTATKKIEIV